VVQRAKGGSLRDHFYDGAGILRRVLKQESGKDFLKSKLQGSSLVRRVKKDWPDEKTAGSLQARGYPLETSISRGVSVRRSHYEYLPPGL